MDKPGFALRAHPAIQSYAFFFDRQPFMKALRSGPFLPVACFAHWRILSCCVSLPLASAVTAAVWILPPRALTADVSSANAAGPAMPMIPARISADSVFIAISFERDG